MACCKDCPDRTIEPINCHMICEKYIRESQESKAIKNKMQWDIHNGAIIAESNNKRTGRRPPTNIMKTNVLHRRPK